MLEDNRLPSEVYAEEINARDDAMDSGSDVSLEEDLEVEMASDNDEIAFPTSIEGIVGNRGSRAIRINKAVSNTEISYPLYDTEKLENYLAIEGIQKQQTPHRNRGAGYVLDLDDDTEPMERGELETERRVPQKMGDIEPEWGDNGDLCELEYPYETIQAQRRRDNKARIHRRRLWDVTAEELQERLKWDAENRRLIVETGVKRSNLPRIRRAFSAQDLRSIATTSGLGNKQETEYECSTVELNNMGMYLDTSERMFERLMDKLTLCSYSYPPAQTPGYICMELDDSCTKVKDDNLVAMSKTAAVLIWHSFYGYVKRMEDKEMKELMESMVVPVNTRSLELPMVGTRRLEKLKAGFERFYNFHRNMLATMYGLAILNNRIVKNNPEYEEVDFLEVSDKLKTPVKQRFIMEHWQTTYMQINRSGANQKAAETTLGNSDEYDVFTQNFFNDFNEYYGEGEEYFLEESEEEELESELKERRKDRGGDNDNSNVPVVASSVVVGNNKRDSFDAEENMRLSDRIDAITSSAVQQFNKRVAFKEKSGQQGSTETDTSRAGGIVGSSAFSYTNKMV
ncbi:hypothetical protein AX774_g7182, partial [Zancudomyces culisetae]